jgi:glycosyltransferase involved in cell wall biosynthesis
MRSMELMVSIVVPVYNAEKYLEDCLISLVDQTYENIEIILVDDGSVDDSGRICDCWAEKDDRIIVYHKKNEGVSATRNFGIQRARGKFLMFVDADDMLVLNTVEYMVKEIIKNNSELVVCKYQSQDYKKNIRESNLRIELLLKEDYLREMMIPEKNIAAFVYNRLYLTQIIMEKNIRFNQNVQVCEDTLFNYEYMKFIKNVVFINNALYFYRINAGSTMFKKEMNPAKLTANIVFDKMLNDTDRLEEKKIIAVGCIAYNVILLMQMYKYKWKNKNDYIIVKKHLKIYPMEFMKSIIKFKYKIGYLVLLCLPIPRYKMVVEKNI